MSVPNQLTIVRIVLGAIVPFMMLYGGLYTRITAGVLFAFAGATDYLDGWYARKYNVVTKLGKILDPIADKVIILGAFIVFSSLTNLDLYSFWWIVPIFFREILITLIRFFFLSKDQPLVVAASWSGKLKTAVQFLAIPIIYLVFMFRQYGNLQPALWQDALMFGMLGIATFITLQSGWSFFSKNWRLLWPKTA